MQVSQALLLLGILGFAIYTIHLRSVILARVIYLSLVGAGVVLALDPHLSTIVAHRVGIGRGADLMLYLFVIFSLFHFVNLASHLQRLDRQITALVRHCALERATVGGDERSADAQRPQA